MPGVFNLVKFIALIYCLVAGVRLTADCVSTEKRQGTLGFLFLTHLRGYDVILGKLIAKAVLPACTVLTIVPIVWLVSLWGGVTGEELLYTITAIANALFFSLAVGITVSTFFLNRRRCELIATTTIILLFFVIFPLADLFIQSLLTGASGTWAIGSSLFQFLTNRVSAVANPIFSGPLGNQAAIISNMVVHFTSWLLIAVSSWWIPRSWKERPPTQAQLSLKDGWKQWIYGSGTARALRRRAALEANPFFWRAIRNRIRPLIPWLFACLTLGIPILIVFSIGFSPPGFYTFLVFIVVCWYLMPKFWIAREAARTLSNERSEGTLEMVLSTPLSVREIVRGQWMGLRKCYRAALVFPIALSGMLIIGINFVPSFSWLSGTPYATPLLIAVTILFLFDCVTLGWVGMWAGLKLGNTQTATRSAMSKVITIPVLIFELSFLAVAVSISWQGVRGPSPYIPIGLWLVTGLSIDVLLIKSSRALIYREFRNIVQEPARARDAWARALGRWFGGLFRRQAYNRVN